MPLEPCPWMAARCPHYKEECKEADSVHCFYVKNTIASARALLRQIQSAPKNLRSPNPVLEQQIRELEEFLASSGG